MPIAGSIYKTTSYKKQTALGSVVAGAGGKVFRRTSAVFKADRDMYESNEIVTHHQSTGSAYGLQKADGKGDALLSPGTFADLMAAICERDFAAASPGAAAAATTVAFVSGYTYTITRGAGSFLTDGLEVGLVARITGAGIHANNIAKNLWITAVTALVCTVYVLNKTAMNAEGPIATYVLTVVGKTTFVPETAHTKDYFGVEEWRSDLTRSELYNDMRVGSMTIGLPATGNNTLSVDFVGLSRTKGSSQILTSPTTTSTAITSAANGQIMVNGVIQTVATGISFTVSNSAANAGAVIGSNTGADVLTGVVKVSGTLTALFDSVTLQNLYDAKTNVPIDVVTTADETATSEFLAYSMNRVKFTGDAPDDAQSTVRTYPFTAEIDIASSTTGTARNKTILATQDSAA